MAAGGTVTMESPPRILRRPTLQLQVPSSFTPRAPPPASSPNHPHELSRKISGLGLDVGGMGRKGLEFSLVSEDSACSNVPAYASLRTPFLSVQERFYGLVLSLKFFILKIRQQIKCCELFR